MRMVIAAVLVACSIAVSAASMQDEKKNKDNARVMIVTGCINGSRLEVIRVDNSGSTIDHFTLRGNKEMMKVLTKDMNGHMVEVTGVVDDSHKKQGAGKTIHVGKKTTITTGAREVSANPDPTTDAKLSVESYRDLEPHCSSR